MKEVFQTIWSYALPIGGGITVGALAVTILTIILKGTANKLIAKVNVEETQIKAVEKGVEKIKNISFSQNIQPLVESELKKVTETANKYIKEQLEEVDKNYLQLVSILEKFACYFDNSIAVTEEKKEELAKAIETAKNGAKTVESVKVEVEVEEKPKTALKTEKTAKITVER